MIHCVMVILNYKDSERAATLAKRCSAFDTVQKVIIVDNDSKDGSYEKLLLLDSEKIDIIGSEKNGGFAAGNNIGAKYAIEKYHPKYLLFANTDTVFPEENVVACINALEENKELGLVSTRMIGPDDKEQNASYEYPTYSSYLKGYFWLARRLYYKNVTKEKTYSSNIVKVDFIRGSFMLFNAKAIEEANYFDDNTFLYCEELIVCQRLNKCGYKVGLLTDRYYLHDHIETNSSHNIASSKQLYISRYYFATNYWGINALKRMLMKVLSKYSIIEMRFIEFLKRLVKEKM